MVTIIEDYVSFEIAKLLKEKGFNEGCSFIVNATSKGMMPVSWPTTNSDIEDEKANLIALPTLQMAMKWLREVHHIFLSIQQHLDMSYVWYAYVDGVAKGCDRESHNNTYEQACESAIKYCLENLI